MVRSCNPTKELHSEKGLFFWQSTLGGWADLWVSSRGYGLSVVEPNEEGVF
jgi:hypothetical protein